MPPAVHDIGGCPALYGRRPLPPSASAEFLIFRQLITEVRYLLIPAARLVPLRSPGDLMSRSLVGQLHRHRPCPSKAVEPAATAGQGQVIGTTCRHVDGAPLYGRHP